MAYSGVYVGMVKVSGYIDPPEFNARQRAYRLVVMCPAYLFYHDILLLFVPVCSTRYCAYHIFPLFPTNSCMCTQDPAQ